MFFYHPNFIDKEIYSKNISCQYLPVSREIMSIYLAIFLNFYIL